MSNIAPDVSILNHALGLSQGGRRNHYVTGAGGDDHSVCMNLVARGLMVRYAGNALTGGDDCFVATQAGREYAIANTPAPPTRPALTRSQRRYDDFLTADCDMSFGEWLRRGYYA